MLADSQRLGLALDQIVIAALNSGRWCGASIRCPRPLSGAALRACRSHTGATKLHNNRRFCARLTKWNRFS